MDDAVHRAFREDGWIWVSNLFAEGYTTKFFVSGWHSALHYVIWSREKKCLLMLPLPVEESWRDQAVELQLHLAIPETSASNPITIGIRIDDEPIENFNLSTDDEILTILTSTVSSRFRGISLVEFHLGAEIGHAESARRPGDMGWA